jgi:choline dehydrogenase
VRRRDFIKAVSVAAAASRPRPARAQTPPDYDCIVIGAGSAGCVVANRLTARPELRVLVLEAGGPLSTDAAITTPGRWVSLIGSTFDWGYVTEPESGMNHRRITFPRGKVVGGSSAINAMAYIRGHRLDFDGWQRSGNQGWAYDEVLPVFRRLEDNSRGASKYRGAGGPLRVSDGLDAHPGHHAFLDAAKALGYRANPTWEFSDPQPEDGAGFYQKNIKDGRRHSAAEAFLVPVLGRKNLQIVTGAQATRLIIEGTRVVGVEYVREGRREQARARREVVLCGGVVESPKLLMLSGIGPAAHLRTLGIAVVADLPGVGSNLQDHLKLSIRWTGRTTLPPSTVTAGMFVRSTPRAIESVAHGPDLQFYVGRGVDQPDRFVTITVSLVRPRSRGEIRLRSTDPLAAPVIRANYLSEAADVAALIEGVRLARALGSAPAFEKLRTEEIEPGAGVLNAAVGEFARRAADTIYHPAGTCRMGTDELAVVDPQLRLRGFRGLRIADASVMPNVVSATTHATCVMIGDRAADFMLG